MFPDYEAVFPAYADARPIRMVNRNPHAGTWKGLSHKEPPQAMVAAPFRFSNYSGDYGVPTGVPGLRYSRYTPVNPTTLSAMYKSAENYGPHRGYGSAEDAEAGELKSLKPGTAIAAGGMILGLWAIGTFAFGPWVVKQFKPNWKYSKRLVTAFLASTAIGIARKAAD
jgi:hypothetical protein